MTIKVVIADADAEFRHACRTDFPGDEFRVVTAADGLACLAAVAALRPDVLVVDVDMPWGGGDGVLARLGEDGLLADIPTVLVTGYRPEVVLSERTGLPRDCCLEKPLETEALRRRILATFPTSGNRVGRPG